MTIETVQARIDALAQERAALTLAKHELASELEAVVAKINAFNGAIEDCQFWLAQLSEEASDGDQEDNEEGRTYQGLHEAT